MQVGAMGLQHLDMGVLIAHSEPPNFSYQYKPVLPARRSHGATGVQRTRTGSESFYDAPETLSRINSGASLSSADGAQRSTVPSSACILAESFRLQTSMQITLSVNLSIPGGAEHGLAAAQGGGPENPRVLPGLGGRAGAAPHPKDPEAQSTGWQPREVVRPESQKPCRVYHIRAHALASAAPQGPGGAEHGLAAA